MRKLAFLIILLLVPVAAQNQEAAPPSDGDSVLYASHAGSGDQFSGWMTTDANDPDNGAVAVGDSIPEECVALDVGCEWKAFDFTWAWELVPQLTEDLYLAGDIVITAHMGSQTGSGSGIELTSRLYSGPRLVAFGNAQQYAYSASGSGEFDTVTWTLPVTNLRLDADEPLVWSVRARGSDGEASENLQMGTSDARGRSSLTLPVAPAPPEPEGPAVYYNNITQSIVVIEKNFPNKTTESHVYNWTNEFPDVSLDWKIHGVGSIYVSATLNGTPLPKFKISGNNSILIEEKGAGDWNVQIDLVDFNGSLYLSVVPLGYDPETGEVDPEKQASNNAAMPPDGDDPKQRPSFSPILMIAGIVALGLVVVLAVIIGVSRRA